ncbi:dehydrogenase [Lysobacter xinjiangensis]|uniref:Dehydrogenase n=1 Tax=Cognatilysobacter xinjiangensis TaxID=546892 RepID=A0ABQ3C2V3_9GAMM|nr:PQQ-dependent sugar dehydrogenase [Lysobacter xinjiangensis]GGZ60350.1 dehydrogenase [Lysobacter xinjiangensis]
MPALRSLALAVLLASTGTAVAQQARVDTVAGPLRAEQLATLEFPWGLALLPDGRVLVTEKPGRLRIWTNGRLSAPVRGLPAVYHRDDHDQGGLLDVEADPDFARNGYVYFSYVEAADPQPAGQEETGEIRFGKDMDLTDNVVRGGVVARGRLVGDELRDVQVIWRQVPKTLGRGHFGGRILFAQDGTMYVTSSDRQRFDPAQHLQNNLGKIVRINRDGTVPRGNPDLGKGARGEIWSYGHRNVIAAAIDPANGNIWAFEMGPKGGDEVNLIKAGKNYGWPTVSNGDNYDGSVIPDHPSHPEFEAPLRSWTPVVSPSGALFYTGTLFPQWRGNLLVGGLSSKSIVRLQLDGTRIAAEERIDVKRRIRDLLQMPDGSLLVIEDAKAGALLRLQPDGASTAGR